MEPRPRLPLRRAREAVARDWAGPGADATSRPSRAGAWTSPEPPAL